MFSTKCESLESFSSDMEKIGGPDAADLTESMQHNASCKKQPSLLGRILGAKSKSPTPPPKLASPELPPLSRLILAGYAESTRHRLLDEELAGNIRNLLPPRLQLFDQWELVYSLEQHGISLNSLYRNCNIENQLQKMRNVKNERGFADNIVRGMVTFGSDTHRLSGPRPHGYVMVIRDEKNNRFGCYLNENLRPLDQKRYYGNGECFLWKCEWYDGSKLLGDTENKALRELRFKAFLYTGLNDNVIYSNLDFIAVGSSQGQNGLWIDKSLYSGVSYPCETFGNEILNEQERTGNKFGKFKIMSLEVWRVGNLQ